MFAQTLSSRSLEDTAAALRRARAERAALVDAHARHADACALAAIEGTDPPAAPRSLEQVDITIRALEAREARIKQEAEEARLAARVALSARISELGHEAAKRYAKACQEATEALADLLALDQVGSEYGTVPLAPGNANEFMLPLTERQHEAARRGDQYHPPTFSYLHNVLTKLPEVQRRIAAMVRAGS